jgi:hypothetical protein
MKKIFTFGILTFVLAVAAVVPSLSSAQLSGQLPQGLATYQKFLAGQIKCSDMTNSDFFDIGDYVLKQVPEAQRGAINEYINQYKGKLSDKDFSTLMGKYFSGCEVPAAAGIGQENTSGDNPNGAGGNRNESNGNNKGDNSQPSGEEHRSAVSTFVKSLLDVANRETAVGDQVRTIANAQNDSKDNVANAIDKVKNRAGWKTFLIGTDYKSTGQLRSAVTTTTNQIDQLTKLAGQTTNPVDKATLEAAINAAQQQLQKMNDFIKANEGKFSLFGWLVKLFNK